MPLPAIDKLTMEELSQLIDDATQRRESMIAEKRAELQKQLAALDALALPPRASSKPLSVTRQAPEPKYRSKKNPSLTWSARGSQPTWLKAEIEETGGKLEDFAIK